MLGGFQGGLNSLQLELWKSAKRRLAQAQVQCCDERGCTQAAAHECGYCHEPLCSQHRSFCRR